MKSYKDYMADKGIPEGPWVIRESDTLRMAETAETGSVRSKGSAVPQGIRPLKLIGAAA